MLYRPVGSDCRIHQQHLCRGVSYLQRVHVYDIKLSYGKVPALKIWGMWSTPSLPLFPCSLWPGVVALDRILSIGQTEQTACKQMTGVKLWQLCSKTWNHLGGCPRGVMVKSMDCGIVVSEFVLQSRYYVQIHLEKLWTPWSFQLCVK